MPKLSTEHGYTPEQTRRLFDRAHKRSGLSLARFARELLVRDVHTVRRYRESGEIPGVVIARLEQLAKRRAPRAVPTGRRAPLAWGYR